MSYDISIGEMRRNMTSNVSPMWDKAMPNLNLRDMGGLTGAQCVDALAAGVEDMAKNRNDYLSLEPDNGWGDFGGALAVLVEMLIECSANPTRKVYVWV